MLVRQIRASVHIVEGTLLSFRFALQNCELFPCMKHELDGNLYNVSDMKMQWNIKCTIVYPYLIALWVTPRANFPMSCLPSGRLAIYNSVPFS